MRTCEPPGPSVAPTISEMVLRVLRTILESFGPLGITSLDADLTLVYSMLTRRFLLKMEGCTVYITNLPHALGEQSSFDGLGPAGDVAADEVFEFAIAEKFRHLADAIRLL